MSLRQDWPCRLFLWPHRTIRLRQNPVLRGKIPCCGRTTAGKPARGAGGRFSLRFSKEPIMKKVKAVFFSPTGTTRAVVCHIAREMASSLALPFEEADFTLPSARNARFPAKAIPRFQTAQRRLPVAEHLPAPDRRFKAIPLPRLSAGKQEPAPPRFQALSRAFLPFPDKGN